MRILITGCAGFIGSVVARSLIEQEQMVVGIDDLNALSYDPRLKECRLEDLQKRGWPSIRSCRLNEGTWEESVLGEFDAIIHLAARAGVRQSLEDPAAYYRTNVDGTLKLLDFAHRRSIPKVVLASTSSVYGASDRMPFQESDPADRPLSPYASSKRAAELVAHAYHHNYGLDVTVLRYFTVYGPAGRPDMSIFRFIRWIDEGTPLIVFGDGTQQRDFTYVDDIAAGTVAALRPAGFEVYNLGSDRPVRLDFVISLIEEELARSSKVEHRPAHPADVKASWASIGRARSDLEWAPSVAIEEGIKKTAAWYRDNRTLAQSVAIT